MRWLAILGVLGVPAVMCGADGGAAISLNDKQIETARRIVLESGRAPANLRFETIARAEPLKSPDGAAERGVRAKVVAFDPAGGGAIIAIVDLDAGRLLSLDKHPHAQPGLIEEDFERAIELTRADKRWQAAIRERGIESLDAVQVDVWASGVFSPNGARLVRTLAYFTKNIADPVNTYSRPIEGVETLVDLTAGKIVEVIDRGDVPLPEPRSDDAPPPTSRPALRPLEIRQPEGSSVRVVDGEFQWDSWRFRIEYHPRVGLILRDVAWQDGEKRRSVLAAANVSEMVVPYGDASPGWQWRIAFDAGEYGLGRCGQSLEPGGDVPEHALLLDAWMNDDAGEAVKRPRVVAIYERDAGLGWRHADTLTGRVDRFRARELCIFALSTVGNYDYGFEWTLRQDASIGFEAQLTGIILPKATAAASCSACVEFAEGKQGESVGDERYGKLVTFGVVAPYHQHWFNLRLDFDVDGPENSLLEMNTRHAGPNEENPFGNAFTMQETLLTDEREARRDIAHLVHRKWRIVNPENRNALGHLAGYVLVPGENSAPFAKSDSALITRAPFLQKHVWATRFKADELYAAGEFPNQSRGGEGLFQWSNNEPIVKQDLVVWYNMGVTHTTRPEEWPVMPVSRAGFQLMPVGFFSGNPAYWRPGNKVAK
ncbi:MAG: amine oxidase [Planctomycetota bacterium]